MAEADRVKRIYNRAAATYDAAVRMAFLEELRSRTLARAHGDTLELGVGTGASLPHYPADLASLTALDISEEMIAQAQGQAGALPFPIRFLIVDFQRLSFPDASFDTVTTSLAMCGIPDPGLLFREIKRVLRPGGQLLSVEHIRPPNPLLGLLADIGSPINNFFVGCYLNRRTPDLLRAAGFDVRILDRRFLNAVVAFIATPRGG